MRLEEDFKVIDHYLCVCMPKEVDHHNARAIMQYADEMICTRDVKNLIFDFSETEFMDSSGIGVIMGRYRTVHLMGGEVWVIHASERMKKILNPFVFQ